MFFDANLRGVLRLDKYASNLKEYVVQLSSFGDCSFVIQLKIRENIVPGFESETNLRREDKYGYCEIIAERIEMENECGSECVCLRPPDEWTSTVYTTLILPDDKDYDCCLPSAGRSPNSSFHCLHWSGHHVVTDESLLKSVYISGLKPLLKCALLRLAPTTLEEAFSIARIMEARFEIIAGKKLNIEEKIDIVLSWPSKEVPPEIKGSLDVDEDIGVDAVSSAIDCVIHIGESNEVRSKFGEFSDNKERVVEVVVGGGEALGVYREKSRGAAEGGRRVLCYVQGSRRRKKKKMEAAIQRRLWDPEIKSVFQDNTLRARWF
ncbi:hypothetical protein Tco_0526639 [Tanacetum coccineum]